VFCPSELDKARYAVFMRVLQIYPGMAIFQPKVCMPIKESSRRLINIDLLIKLCAEAGR
jgi:hypothetical protein